MKDDQRIALTKRLLREGLLRLFSKTDLNKISVTQLCIESGINRATFYRHYEEPRDILNDIKYEIFQEVEAFEEKPAKIFVVHGESDVCDSFAQCLKDEHGFNAVAPYSGDAYDLITGEQIAQGNRELVEKKKQGVYRASSSVFDRLMIAGERLIAVIKKCQGMANKDLAKFADQINALCDKWDR